MVDIKLPADQTDAGAMATYYTQHEDGTFVELGEQELKPDPTAMSKCSIIPAKIALDALGMQLTPWEVYKRLCKYKQDKCDKVKELLKPCKDWALAAALRGASADNSKLAYILTPVTRDPWPGGKGPQEQVEGNARQATAGETSRRGANI